MKTIALLSALILLSFGCKKGKLANPVKETYCIFKVESNGSKSYLECVNDKNAAAQRVMYYRDNGINTETKKTNGCDECN